MKYLFMPVMLLACCPVIVQAQMVMSAHTLIEEQLQHGSSGTSAVPDTTPIPMLMGDRDGWLLMLHTNIFIANTQQQAANERGRDAFFSTSWIMPMAQRRVGAGEITLRTMISLEPATVGGRNYPELFQQGETAFGSPIVDGQHPHNFIMELAALYDLPVGKNALLSLYAAPVGDPAIGPSAYPHRQSASEDPIAALGHHQEDSTHIAYNVVTGGVTYKWARVELSGFHGGEPDEHRFAFQGSPNGHNIDSVATRLTLSPTPDITGQYSIAHIVSPEALYPGEDQQRQTASVMYHHTFHSAPMQDMPGMDISADKPASRSDDMAGMKMQDMPGMDMGAAPPSTTGSAKSKKSHPLPAMQMAADPSSDLSTTLLWGCTRSLRDNSKDNSYLAEALLRFASTNYVWTRLENAGRSNELLLAPGHALPTSFAETPVGHVAAYTFGYDRDFALGPHLLAAPGAQFTVYRTPSALRSTYGATPTAETIFIRFRLR